MDVFHRRNTTPATVMIQFFLVGNCLLEWKWIWTVRTEALAHDSWYLGLTLNNKVTRSLSFLKPWEVHAPAATADAHLRSELQTIYI